MTQIVNAQIQYNSVEQVARPINDSSGVPRLFSNSDDTANRGRWIGEAAAVNVGTPVSYGTVTLNAFKLTSDAIQFTAESLIDPAFNIFDDVIEKIGARMGKSKADKYSTGAGTTEPQGIVGTASTGVTTAATSAFTLTEVMNMMYSIDPIYWQDPDASWLCSAGFYQACTLLLDANDRPILNSSLQGVANGFPFQLLGRPVRIVNNLGAVSAGNTVALFGVYKNFVVRNAGPLRLVRLNELYAANDMIAVQAFSRHDSNYLGASSNHQYKKMVMHA